MSETFLPVPLHRRRRTTLLIGLGMRASFLFPEIFAGLEPGGTARFLITYPVDPEDVAGREEFEITDCVFIGDDAVGRDDDEGLDRLVEGLAGAPVGRGEQEAVAEDDLQDLLRDLRLEGEIPEPSNPPSGCVFQTRCPRKIGEICETVEPELEEAEPGWFKRCHIPIEQLREAQVDIPA